MEEKEIKCLIFKLLEDEARAAERGMTLEEFFESERRLIREANEIVDPYLNGDDWKAEE